MRAGVARRGRAGSAAACALFAALLAAPRAQAAAELGLTAGTTLGVNGEPGTGGVSTSAALLWPFGQPNGRTTAKANTATSIINDSG